MASGDFSDAFLFGAATSSHQVEGYDTASDWWAWERTPGRIEDGTTAGEAAGWWTGKAEEDLAAAAELGQNAHRMSLEWSRLEPEAGRFDRDAFERYRQILRFARERGLTTLLTLNHFTLPRWVERLGGWAHPNVPALFEGFADRAARELGSLPELWATLNEPSVLAFMGYASGRWPPGHTSLARCFVALRRMLDGHARAYRALHRELPQPRVGVVLNCPWFVPADPSRRLDRLAAAAQDWAFNGATLRALRDGTLRFPLALTSRAAPELAGTLDWIGLNYYGRYDVRFDPTSKATPFGRHVQAPTVRTEHNDWGRPSPEGMVAQLERLSAFGVPLYVTENGTFEPSDSLRGAASYVDRDRYLVEHVDALAFAVKRGLDVRGYFHWSLVDNFEWAEGWSTRFGLLALDRETQTRTPRPIASTYAAICRARGVPDGLKST